MELQLISRKSGSECTGDAPALTSYGSDLPLAFEALYRSEELVTLKQELICTGRHQFLTRTVHLHH